ncbi:PAS domain S-box protein [Candidatus Latescibacterota bacterium]
MKAFRHWPIRNKLIFIQLFLAFIVLLFYSFYAITDEVKLYKSNVVENVRIISDILGEQSKTALNFLDIDEADKILSLLEVEKNVLSAVLYDENGDVFSYFGTMLDSLQTKKATFKEIREFQKSVYLSSGNIVQDDIIIGSIELVYDISPIRKKIAGHLLMTLPVFIIGMLVALLLSVRTQRTISLPINKLVSMAKNVIENHDYNVVIKDKSDDEVGELASTFEEMMSTLALHENELKMREHDLGKRIKELKCLYGTSTLLTDQDLSSETAFQRIVEMLPPGWNYPDITCGRIIIRSNSYVTANFKETAWKLIADIATKDNVVGAVEVYYLEEKPELDEGPFVSEERNLIDAVAQRIGDHVEDEDVSRKLKEYQENLEGLVEERTKDFKNSETRANALFEFSPEGVVIVNARGSIVKVNSQVEKYFGYSKNELVGKDIERLVPERIREKHVGYRNKYLKDPKMRLKEISLELIGERKDGTEFPVLVSLGPIEQEEGLLVIASVRNITERKKSEEELKDRMEDLERFSRLTIDREEKMIQLKEEINALYNQMGKENKYKIVE